MEASHLVLKLVASVVRKFLASTSVVLPRSSDCTLHKILLCNPYILLLWHSYVTVEKKTSFLLHTDTMHIDSRVLFGIWKLLYVTTRSILYLYCITQVYNSCYLDSGFSKSTNFQASLSYPRRWPYVCLHPLQKLLSRSRLARKKSSLWSHTTTASVGERSRICFTRG